MGRTSGGALFGRLCAVVLAGVLVASILAPPKAVAGPPDHRAAHELVSGLTLIRLRWDDAPVRAFVLRIDLTSDVTSEVALGRPAYPALSASVADIAARSDAVAAVNGDFGDYRPLGPFVHDGRVVQSGLQSEAVLAISADRSAAFVGRPRLRSYVVADGSRVALDAWNSGPPSGDEIVAFSSVGGLLEMPPARGCSVRLERATRGHWTPDLSGVETRFRVAEVTCGTSPRVGSKDVVLTALRQGGSASFLRSLGPGDTVRVGWRARWAGVADMQGGGPVLLDHGRVVVPSPCPGILCLRHPRTGLGVSEGCEDERPETRCVLFYVVVDGRQSGWSLGMTLQAFARLMRRVGASSAINLDGGGSSTMAVNGEVVNRPSLGNERPVPAAFLVLRRSDPDEAWLTDALTLPRWAYGLRSHLADRWTR
ncbi:MAG: phosphodiester glycosidase family protein [Solirubrobacterales bacterium]